MDGKKANLPKRFVSRERLYLAGTTGFWINDQSGMPLMVITAEINEKLKTREKKTRLDAKVYNKIGSNKEMTIDEIKTQMVNTAPLIEQINVYKKEIGGVRQNSLLCSILMFIY